MSGAEEPDAALPLRRLLGFAGPLQRQHVADHLAEPTVEDRREPRALFLVLELRLERVDVHRQPPFPPEVVPDVLVRGDRMLRVDAQHAGELHDEVPRVRLSVPVVDGLVGDERVVLPDRLAVAPPPAAERPARQRFAGIPLALSEVEQTAGCELLLQTLDQVRGQPALVRTERGETPFGALHVVDRHEGRLPSHREPHVAARKIPVDLVTARDDREPLLLGVGLGDARGFVDPPHAHLVAELHLGFVGGAGHRRGAGGVGCRRERDVAFAGEETRRWDRARPSPLPGGRPPPRRGGR